MTKKYVFFIVSLFAFNMSFGQILGEYYVPVTIDNTDACKLKFLNDSIVELSSIPHHMNPSLKFAYRYKMTDSTIEIIPELLKSQDSLLTGLYIQNSFIKTRLILTKIEEGLIDYDKSIMYVKEKDFGYRPDIAIIVNGEMFIQNMGVTNGYGLIEKKTKVKRALQRKLKTIDKDHCTIEILRGLNAYKRFGIKKVYGVIVIADQ